MPDADPLELDLRALAERHGLGAHVVDSLVRATRAPEASGRSLPPDAGTEDPPAQIPADVAAMLPGADWTINQAHSLPRASGTAEQTLGGPLDLPPRYEDLGVIGLGGMGEVRRVRDLELNRQLAMKILHGQFAGHRDLVARFVEEAQATAQLEHPGVIPVHDTGTLLDGRPYFTMKEIRGRTLSDVIQEAYAPGPRDRQAWTLRRLIDAFRTVCEAIAFAHARGVIHRDIKPTNVMVGNFGEVVVTDWGLAKVVGREGTDQAIIDLPPVQTVRSADEALATRAGGVAGTPSYMPPEQARGELALLGTGADVYALGATLYEVLSGRPPYDGRDANAVLAAVLAGPPPPPGRALPGLAAPDLADLDAPEPASDAAGPLIPAELVEICQRAMAREPEHRYADAAEMAYGLSAWLEGARRQDQAGVLVGRADAMLPETEQLRSGAQSLRVEAESLLVRLEPWAPVEAKRAAWALQDDADGMEWRAERLEAEARQLIEAALTYDPGHAAAHARLAALYLSRQAEAEQRRDRLEAAHYGALVARHDPRHDARKARGEGLLTLVTDPPDALVELCAWEQVDRRLSPKAMRSLGRTPLIDIPLRAGSWLLRISAPQRATVLYPVLIRRDERWDGVPPGQTEPQPVRLPRVEAVGPLECYVPAGYFWCGGDPEAAGSLPRQRIWVDAFIIRSLPVSNREYLGFLNGLVAQGKDELALTCAPRERTPGGEGELLYSRTPTGRFSLRSDAEGNRWGASWPALLIDHASARLYARWLAERTARPWRLPSELEWEKAARGVDGRLYPWGDYLDPTWCCLADSHPGRPVPTPVDAWPLDISPYGALCMAGNSRDWCDDRWSARGPAVEGGRALPPAPDDDDPDALRLARGGWWDGEARAARTAGRQRYAARRRGVDTGFRLLRPLEAPPPAPTAAPSPGIRDISDRENR